MTRRRKDAKDAIVVDEDEADCIMDEEAKAGPPRAEGETMKVKAKEHRRHQNRSTKQNGQTQI